MKLEKILDQLSSFEKNSFLKIIDNIISSNPKNYKTIEKILSDTSKDLKSVDNINIARVFQLIEEEFSNYVQSEFSIITSQLNILIDILIRDGNCIMKRDWFARLYENEIKSIKRRVKELKTIFELEKPEIDEKKLRDYKIYKSCLNTAYLNDLQNNREAKISNDESSILETLAKELSLSQEEIKLITYSTVPLKIKDIDSVINYLKNLGIIFYSKKSSTIFVADEMVRLLRRVRGKEIADKYFRRVLRLLSEPQINLVCKRYNIDRKLSVYEKIKKIIHSGISFRAVLSNDIYKNDTKLSEKKAFINELCNKKLKLPNPIKGTTLDEKISNLIYYFNEIELDEKVGISIDGFEKLLVDLGTILPSTNSLVRSEFELQDEDVLKSNYLLNYNIKPRDILDLIHSEDLMKFCKEKGIKTRGNLISNILESYKDVENLYLENYVNIGYRDLNQLKENGIVIKEAELGIKFEDLTKLIFSKLGFNVDEKLRKSINTKKDKIDIILNLDNNDLILIECKTVKESGYNKFSSVSRQLKAYSDLVKSKGFKVIKLLLIAPEFSDEFVNECELEYELNLSLITASSLIKILEGFKASRHKQFPYKLLMRDVLIKEERILRAISN